MRISTPRSAMPGATCFGAARKAFDQAPCHGRWAPFLMGLALMAALTPLPGSASSLYSWTGTTSAQWGTATNWSPNGIPTDGDTLAFPSGASNLINTNNLPASTTFVSLTFNGGGYTLNGNAIGVTGSITANAGTTTINQPISIGNSAVTLNASDLVLGGALSGTGSITTSPTGSNGVRIATSGSFTGTIIANGHLHIDAVTLPATSIASTQILQLSGSSLASTAVTHSSGSYALFGTGTIGALTATGPVFPGGNYSCGFTSPSGVLNTGNANLSDKACFALNGPTVGTGYSQLNVAGSVTLGASSTLNIALSPSYVPTVGQTFVLINNDGLDPVNGTFNGLPQGSTITLNSVYQFTISYNGGSGNDVVLTCTAAPHAWTGATSGLWSNANNWNPASVPTAGETLLFPSGASNTTNTNDLPAFTSFASLFISGGGYTLNGNSIVLTNSVSATGGSTTLNLPINVSTNAVSLSTTSDLLIGGALAGTGPITITPTGGFGVQISTSGSYSGTITNNGVLTINSVSLPMAGIVNNNLLHLNGATLPATAVTHTSNSYALYGSGTIGALTASGSVFPGDAYSCGNAAARQLNTGNVNLTGPGCFTLNGSTAGTGYSQLNVAGTVTLGATSSLTLTLSPSFVPAQGQTFVLINNDGGDAVNGIFNGKPEGSIVTLNSVYQFTLSYVGGTGNDVVLTCIVAPHAWTGATSALWSNANNWNPATVPVAGDTLLFPSGAANLTNTNDLAPYTSFARLVIAGGGYTLNGNDIVLTGPITAQAGTTHINLPINVSTNAITFDANDLIIGGSLNGTGPITIAPTGSNGVRIAASGSYTGTFTGNGPLTFDAVAMPAAGIVTNSILHLNGTSLPATAVTHGAFSYAMYGTGTVGALTATGNVFPGGAYSCGFTAPAGLLNSGSVNLSNQVCFAMNGAAVGSGYSQLNVTGTVTLGASAQLSPTLSTSYIPAQGQQFILIKNDGTDAVSGIFNGKPEGSIITLNGVYQFVLSYVGGTGNDVVLTSLNGLPLPNVNLTSSLNPSTPSANVTFTATVSGSGPVPTGTVTFFDGATPLATNPLNGSGIATYATTALAVGTHSIIAQYNSDPNYGGNVSPTLAQVVGQASQFLTFGAPPTVTIAATGTVNAASANPNSGNPIQYSTTSPACTVNSSSGVVTGLTVGTNNCTITATQPGNVNYLVGTATQILSINKVTSATNLSSNCMRTFVEAQPFTFQATVTGFSVTGSVTFNDGNTQTLCTAVPLSGGMASCTTSLLTSASPLTTYSLNTSYSGDSNNITSLASSPLVVTVLDTAEAIFRHDFETTSPQCPVQ